MIESIAKPLSSERIIRSLSKEALEHAPDARPANAIERSAEGEFLAVSASDFLTGAPSFFDVYLKLPSGKFVRILEAKDSFPPSRVVNYLSKGPTRFYLKTESYQRCLTYCDFLAKRVLDRGDLSLELKLSETLNQGQEVLELARELGLGAQHIDQAHDFLAGLHRLQRQLKLDTRAEIRKFLASLRHYEHAISVTVVAALLTTPMQIETERAYRTVGLAGLLHDVGLLRMPDGVEDLDEDTHARIGAGILAGFEEIDPAVVQAVAQHHRRRHIHGGDIAPIAEIVGISDEFAHWVARSRVDPSIDPIEHMASGSFDGFSFPVIDAFRSVFMRH